MKNKKKWIITGIVVCLLAVIAVTVILIIRKNSNKSNMVYLIEGLMVGMDYDKAMEILKDRGIDVEIESEDDICIELKFEKQIYIDLFEEEVSLYIEADKRKNRIEELDFTVWYNTKEECVQIRNKIEQDFNNRFPTSEKDIWYPKEGIMCFLGEVYESEYPRCVWFHFKWVNVVEVFE